MQKSNRILISGKPGIGKTTAIKKICDALKTKHFDLRGIYTSEVRQDGYRIGFEVINIVTGEREMFACVDQTWKGPKVGKYTVNTRVLERVALNALQPAENTANVIYFIDEIGKMELFSEQFKRAVQTLFSLDAERLKIVATVPITPSIPEVEAIRQSKSAMEIVMTNNNRDTLADTVINMIIDCSEK